jgi:hypothetical protein
MASFSCASGSSSICSVSLKRLENPHGVMRNVSSTIRASEKCWRNRSNRLCFFRIVVPHQTIDAVGGDAFDGEERLVVGHAVMALIQFGDDDNRDLQVSLRQRRGIAQFHQHRHQMPHRRGHMGADRDLIVERPVAGGKLLVNFRSIGREFAGRDAMMRAMDGAS